MYFHIKSAWVDEARLSQVGILAAPLRFHTPCIPGNEKGGNKFDWTAFFNLLDEIGYDGPLTLEIEDRELEPRLTGEDPDPVEPKLSNCIDQAYQFTLAA